MTINRSSALPILNTSAALIAQNPVLLYGQIAQETDTNRTKSGDGVSTYTQLTYSEWAYEIVEASGTNTYTGTFSSPFFLTYFPMMRIRVRFTNGNTGASTINLNGEGAKSIKKKVSSDLVSGDIPAGSIHELIYDGTNFQIGSGVGTATFPATATPAGAYLRADGTNWITSTLLLPNSATVNRVVYATATNLWGDSANLTFDGNSLTVGTSVITPKITGSASAAGTLTLQATSNATDGNILFLTDNTTERVRILSTGEVLFGYTSLDNAETWGFQKNQNAATYLTVSNTTVGTASLAGIVASSSSGLTDYIGLYAVDAGYTTSGMLQAGCGLVRSANSAGLNVGTSTNTQMSFYTNNTFRERILSTGEHIIGAITLLGGEFVSIQKSQNALTQLVVSNATSGTAGRSVISATTVGNVGLSMYALSALYTTSGIQVANTSALGSSQTGGLNIGTISNAQMSFWTNNTEMARINASGEFGIGLTASGARLHIAANTTTLSQLKLATGGSLLATATAGSIETDANGIIYYTPTGTDRRPISLAGGRTDSGTTVTIALADIGKIVNCSNTNAVTVNLPAANSVPAYYPVYIKDSSNNAGTNARTVTRAGADTIEGATTNAINQNYQVKGYYSDGTSVWYVI